MIFINKVNIPIKKLHPNAKVPQYQTEHSAGFDFYAVIDNMGYTRVQPKQTVLIKTGLAMAIPTGFELQIRPRSGLSLNTKLRIANSPGTIDADYRGEIGIIVENIGDTAIIINHHDRIAQGVLKKVPQANFVVVDELDNTKRGQGGFGHSGI